MSQISEYFDRIVFTAVSSPKVRRVERVRYEEDATGSIGLIRCRLVLINDDLLELVERVEVQATGVVITKYRHHWQDSDGHLVKRWDNAPHHPDVTSFPHHLHDGAEEHVVEHPPVQGLQILHVVLQSV